MKRRTILHVDLDAFYCSVEELLQPELKGLAFVVGGSPQGRGVVSSASYAARKFGIHSAMPTVRALRLYPDLVVLPGKHKVYAEHSKRVMHFLRESAPILQQISIDEAFLDVSDDPKPGATVASYLQKEIGSRFQLPTSWGVASNKLVAKIATEVGKPNGLIVVPPGQEAQFLAPLPVEMLPGVGPKTRDRLAVADVHRIGELAEQSENRMREVLGDHGPELAARARGRDDRQVVEEREPRSMSAETTFAQDVSDRDQLSRTLLRLSERVGSRLRKSHVVGRTVRVKLRWHDFSTITRQMQLPQPTDQDGEIYQAALALFDRAWRKNRPVRLLGVGVSELGPPLRQLSLFDRTWEQDERLLRAIDSIRARYGSKALRRAGSLRPRRSKGEVAQANEDTRLHESDRE